MKSSLQGKFNELGTDLDFACLVLNNGLIGVNLSNTSPLMYRQFEDEKQVTDMIKSYEVYVKVNF